MYIYWRVQQELSEIGCILVFHHPGMKRELEKWIVKNAAGLAIAEDLTGKDLIKMSLSPN